MKKLIFAIVILCTNSLFAQNVAQDTAQKDTSKEETSVIDPLTVYGVEIRESTLPEHTSYRI